MDYYCFPTKTGDISVFLNLEQYTDYSERFFYQITQEDVMLAKQKGKLLLFDLRAKTFIDCNGNAIDIRGKEIFPRCKIQDSEQLLDAIEKTEETPLLHEQIQKLLKVGLNVLMFKESLYGLLLEKFKKILIFMRKNMEINFS